MLTFEQIKELIELVGERGLQRLEIERSGFSVRIEGRGATSALVEQAPAASPSAPAPPAPAAAPTATATPAEPEAEESDSSGLHILKSPIVGTFYSAPNPDAAAYTKVGERVKAGQVLCIVEAMKLMNEIEADVDGVVREIYPQNAQPVEFGEPLFAIEAD